MKTRVNITLDYDLKDDIKKYIVNLSKFCQKCIERQIEKEKEKEKKKKESQQLSDANLEDLLNEIGDM